VRQACREFAASCAQQLLQVACQFGAALKVAALANATPPRLLCRRYCMDNPVSPSARTKIGYTTSHP
jgi:hypothetical protein